MTEACYSISEVSQKLNVEAHVLRYWEEELNLEVPRNELGHRFYTESLIATIQRIKELRKLGCSLREVRNALDNETTLSEDGFYLAEEEAAAALAENTEDKLARFRDLMADIFAEAMNRSQEDLAQNVSERISEQVGDQLIKEVDYLMQLQTEKQEAHFRKLDESLRSYQKNSRGRAELAVTQASITPVHPRKRFFFRKKRT